MTAESDLEPSDSPKVITPVILQTRHVSEQETDSDDRSESSEIVTCPLSSAASGTEEIEEDLDEDIEKLESDFHIHDLGDEDAAEALEHELDESIQTSPTEIKDWGTLQTQIKKDLKKHSKLLMLTTINQYMILSNFATLRMKGASRIGASEEIA